MDKLKIISGSQAGAERAAIDWAIANGIPYGGWGPIARLATDGPLHPGYAVEAFPINNEQERIQSNILLADATVIFDMHTANVGLLRKIHGFAMRSNKPCLHFSGSSDPKLLAEFLTQNMPASIHICGHWQQAGIYDWAHKCLEAAWKLLKESRRLVFVVEKDHGMKPERLALHVANACMGLMFRDASETENALDFFKGRWPEIFNGEAFLKCVVQAPDDTDLDGIAERLRRSGLPYYVQNKLEIYGLHPPCKSVIAMGPVTLEEVERVFTRFTGIIPWPGLLDWLENSAEES